MGNPAPDFQHNSQLYLSLQKGIEHFNFWAFTKHNLFFGCVYFTVRQVIAATWLNDRDQFLYPNDGWKSDTEFQNDCLTFTLFYGQNRITNNDGINHWIPFTESEVNAQEKFTSNFMTDFIKGKIKPEPMNEGLLFATDTAIYNDPSPRIFSPEATALFDAGRALWTYYHAQKGVNVNASLYDIREHFQGRNDKGRMNARSTDEQYTQLIGNLRARLSLLADKIAPKVYEYEFLKA
jgi:hypothetical protein